MPHVTLRTTRKDTKVVSAETKEEEPLFLEMGPPPLLPPSTPVATLKRAQRHFDKLEEVIGQIRTPSPCKSSFLTKDSNVRDFTAFAVDERLKGVDEELAEMKQLVKASVSEREALDDFIKSQRMRGLCLCQ